MNRFLLKNDTTENVSARVTVSPSDELGNLGHDAATVIEGDRLTTCLAPTAVALPDPTGHRSQCFELKDEGRYAIEINGVIQPYAFSPTDLMDCFNGEHESQIRFLECSENVCLNAIETASTGGVWGDATITINGISYPSIYDAGVKLFVDLVTDGELHFIWNNKTTEFQRVEINNASLNANDYGWGDNTNPTMKYDIANGTIKFCLAPAEEKPEISCAGATSMARMTNGSGTWDIELNGQMFTSPDGWGLVYFIMRTPALNSEIEGNGDGDFFLINKSSSNFQRIRIIPKDGSKWDIHPDNENPTLMVNDDDSISVCLSPVRPPISCDGASPMFEAKTSLEQNTIEVSVDDGPWLSMYDVTDISVSMLPGNPGADVRFSLLDEDARRVRVRTSRDIGLYVNPDRGFDQINTNTAYTLYDRNGLMIDPFDPKNQDHSGREFDYTDTTEDFAVFFAEAEFCLAPIPEETVTVNKPFLEYKNNPTFSSLFSYMSMEYNGKVYTAYHIGFGSSIRDPLLAMLIGEWKAADGEIIKPIGSNIGYEDVYSVPRHFKLVDNAGGNGNIAISGFGDNSLLPNLTFTEDPATMKFIVTPSSGIAPPPEQPEREWVDLIDVYGAGRGSVGDIHFDIEMKTMGYCKK